MDALLTQRWLDDREHIRVIDDASVAVARDAVRDAGRRVRLDGEAIGKLAIVVSELATNQLRHARDGAIALVAIERGGVPGVEVVAVDRGAGIADPTGALDGRSGSAGGLGIGLSGVQRLSDEVDIDVRFGLGTCIRARKFGGSVPRRREVAIVGRCCQGERTSGDDATFERTEDVLVLALADGLGHGPEALVPAQGAIAVVRAAPRDAVVDLLRRADSELEGSRGAVMGVVRIDEGDGSFAHGSVGNVAMQLWCDGVGRSFSGANFVLGARMSRRPRVHEEHGALRPREIVVMYSDGLKSRVDLGLFRDQLRRHPLVLAHQLLETYGRDNDDATVIVSS